MIPRSAVKGQQAEPLVDSGAADALGVDRRDDHPASIEPLDPSDSAASQFESVPSVAAAQVKELKKTGDNSAYQFAQISAQRGELGQRLGDVKPTPLEGRVDCSAIFGRP